MIAADFGIAESCLRNWLRAADVEDGNRPGVTAGDSAELREARRRIRLLEQEDEVLRRAAAYLSQAQLTRNEPRLAIITLDRTHLPPAPPPSRLGRLTPIEYETINTPQTASAA